MQEYQAIIQNQSSLLYSAFTIWQSRSKVCWCMESDSIANTPLVCSRYPPLRNQLKSQVVELMAYCHAHSGTSPQGSRNTGKTCPMYVPGFLCKESDM